MTLLGEVCRLAGAKDINGAIAGNSLRIIPCGPATYGVNGGHRKLRNSNNFGSRLRCFVFGLFSATCKAYRCRSAYQYHS
jgi:hypothetical protein